MFWRSKLACGSKEFNAPFPVSPSGASRGGRVPPTPEARCSPAQNAGKHRCCRLPPQEGCRPLVDPPRALSWFRLRCRENRNFLFG